MLRILTAGLVLFAAQKTFSLEIYRNSLTASAGRWVFYYNEDQHWILKVIANDENGWPKLERQSVFKREPDARAELAGLVAGQVRTRRLPSGEQVLRGRTGASLWPVSNEWSWDWELKYSDWVKTELDKSWWAKKGIATDCADVAYSARWIFARNNGLPMANRLATGQWFTQDSVKPEWENLPTSPDWTKDKKFLAGLNYFLDHVFTHTLWNDSYPIAITVESLIPGSHHLHLDGNTGHTQFVYKVGHQADEIPVVTLNSTVPRKKRELEEFVFFTPTADPAANAFLRMRWPELKNGMVDLKDPTQMPFYSTEQFDASFIRNPRTKFWEEVFYRLDPTADFDLIAQKAAVQIADLLSARVAVVEDGFKVCSLNPCSEGSAEWEAWSTPSRDERILSSINSYLHLNHFIKHWELIEPVLKTTVLNQEGYTFTVSMLMTAFSFKMPASDPNLEPVLRWGVHPRAVGIRAADAFSVGLKERETWLAKTHNCHDPSCLAGSDDFKAASSFSIDSKFSLLGQIARTYCSRFAQPYCADLENYLRSHSVSANGISRSVWEWMQTSFFFNSDPRLSGPLRYTSYKDEIPYFLFSDANVASLASSNGRTFFDGHNFYAMNGAQFSPWTAPAGETPLSLDSHSGWVWTALGNFVLARRDLTAQSLRFELLEPAQKAFAYHDFLLLSQSNQVQLLRIGANNDVNQAAQWAGATFSSLKEGFALIDKADGVEELLDFESGVHLALPEKLNDDEVQLRRFAGDAFLKYSSQSQGRVVCLQIEGGHTVHDLSAGGSCINFTPADQTAVVNINGRALKRVFLNGRLVSEADLGALDDYYSDELLKTTDSTGLRYFCFQGDLLREIQKAPGVRALASCNDQYVIEVNSPGDWDVRDLNTGQVALRNHGFIQFASPWSHEHYVLSGHDQNGKMNYGLLDLNRLDRFMLLTDQQMWGNYSSYERKAGLQFYKGGQLMWLAE